MRFFIGFFGCFFLIASQYVLVGRPQYSDLKKSERALVECLNGKPIQVGDAYFTCSQMRLPKG